MLKVAFRCELFFENLYSEISQAVRSSATEAESKKHGGLFGGKVWLLKWSKSASARASFDTKSHNHVVIASCPFDVDYRHTHTPLASKQKGVIEETLDGASEWEREAKDMAVLMCRMLCSVSVIPHIYQLQLSHIASKGDSYLTGQTSTRNTDTGCGVKHFKNPCRPAPWGPKASSYNHGPALQPQLKLMQTDQG